MIKHIGLGETTNIIALSNSAAAVSYKLSPMESGSLITISPDSSTGSRHILITLPTVAKGLKYSFNVIANSGNTANDIKFTSAHADNDIDGLITGTEASNDNINVTNATTCAWTIDSGVDNTYQYSRWTVTCDGTNWLLSDTLFRIPVDSMSHTGTVALLFTNSVLT